MKNNVEKVYGKDVMEARAFLSRAAVRRTWTPVFHVVVLWLRARDLALHVGVLEVPVFQRHRHRAIEKEERTNAKFAPQTNRKPDATVLSPVMNREADTRKVSTQEFPDAER